MPAQRYEAQETLFVDVGYDKTYLVHVRGQHQFFGIFSLTRVLFDN